MVMLREDWDEILQYVLLENERRLELSTELEPRKNPSTKRKKAFLEYMEEENERFVDMLVFLSQIEPRCLCLDLDIHPVRS